MADEPSTTPPAPAPAKKATTKKAAAPKSAPTGDARRIAELEAENAELRRRMAAAGVRVEPRAPRAPSFGMSEGTRDELEREGRAVDPFTGEKLGDWSNVPGAGAGAIAAGEED